MTLFSQEDASRIADAIAQAETKTSGEIVCVVARSASDYFYVPIIWSAIFSLALPFPLLKWSHLSGEAVHLIQLSCFIGLALVLAIPPIRFALTPRFLKRRYARNAAREQFLAQSIVQTEWRTGVLLYVAEAEHYAEVIADRAIAACVDDQVWKLTIEDLTDALRAGRPADGFVRAIERCGAVLAEHAPPKAHDTNELPNRLILL